MKKGRMLAVIVSAAFCFCLIGFGFWIGYSPNGSIEQVSFCNENEAATRLSRQANFCLDTNLAFHKDFVDGFFDESKTVKPLQQDGYLEFPYTGGKIFAQIPIENPSVRQTVFIVEDERLPNGTVRLILQYEWKKRPIVLANQSICLQSNDFLLLPEKADVHLLVGCYQYTDDSKKGVFFWKEEKSSIAWEEEKMTLSFSLPPNTVARGGITRRSNYIVQMWVTAQLKEYSNDKVAVSVVSQYKQVPWRAYDNYFMCIKS